jgi:hypothetical protein
VVTEFLGVPVVELRFATLDWRHRGDHIRNRSQRKGFDECDVEPEWANEAVNDPDRLVAPDPGSRSGESVRIVGYSRSAGRVLTVIVVPKELTAVSDEWWGATAWASNETDQRKYYTELEEER